jgi:hypothetical protein
MLAAERFLLSRALAVVRTAERAAFAAFYHGPRGGGLNWSFARPLPKVRYLTNAYGLTQHRSHKVTTEISKWKMSATRQRFLQRILKRHQC